MIRFIGYGLLGIILLLLLEDIRFGLYDMVFLDFSCYRPLGGMNWAPVLGLRQGPSHFTGPAYKSPFNLASQT